MFDKTDSKLSDFISEASVQDLTAIASLVFSRVTSLGTQERERFVQELQRDPEARSVFEQLQSHNQ